MVNGRRHRFIALNWPATSSADYSQRDPEQAVEFAKKAIELNPDAANNWSNLCVASYRDGDWQATVDALNKSQQLRKSVDFHHRFFLAMAYWQLGNAEEARRWYDHSVEWMQTNGHSYAEIRRYQAEAEALMEIGE